ncbi:MAG: hypothetical protein ACTTKI_00410 [Tannerella sp.]|uniref:hypothetical protein n=1 Tax=Tannerella sp. TaxID=2382127 RepID=UPI003FA274BD
MTSAIRDIFEGQADEIHPSIFEVYNKNYHGAITSVFGTKDTELSQLFKLNLSKFAACKSFEVTGRLVEARKQFDRWEDYAKVARGIVNEYNRYQRTEFNTIVARARTAKQFLKFLEEKDVLPNLKWLPTVSVTPRDIHVILVNTVRPIDDPLWQIHQPGNLYGCKCDWENTSEPVTDSPLGELPKPARGLEGNPAVTGEIFTERHSYYDYIREQRRHVPKLGVLMQPDKLVYINRPTPDGGTIQVHYNALQEYDEINRPIAETLHRNGYRNIRMLPEIHVSQNELRRRYYGDRWAAQTGCPDAEIGGEMVEFKWSSKRNLRQRAIDAAAKSDVVVIRSREKLEEWYIHRFLEGRIKDKELQNVKEIILINADGKVYKLPRRDAE